MFVTDNSNSFFYKKIQYFRPIKMVVENMYMYTSGIVIVSLCETTCIPELCSLKFILP